MSKGYKQRSEAAASTYNGGKVDALGLVLSLLVLENICHKQLLQLLVGKIDAKLKEDRRPRRQSVRTKCVSRCQQGVHKMTLTCSKLLNSNTSNP